MLRHHTDTRGTRSTGQGGGRSGAGTGERLKKNGGQHTRDETNPMGKRTDLKKYYETTKRADDRSHLHDKRYVIHRRVFICIEKVKGAGWGAEGGARGHPVEMRVGDNRIFI